MFLPIDASFQNIFNSHGNYFMMILLINHIFENIMLTNLLLPKDQTDIPNYESICLMILLTLSAGVSMTLPSLLSLTTSSSSLPPPRDCTIQLTCNWDTQVKTVIRLILCVLHLIRAFYIYRMY